MQIINSNVDNYVKQNRIIFGKELIGFSISFLSVYVFYEMLAIHLNFKENKMASWMPLLIILVIFSSYIVILKLYWKIGNKKIDNLLPWLKGDLGEKKVLTYLKNHFDDDWFYINNFHIPNLQNPIGDIDGILIGPKGIFVLEIKNWAGYFTVSPEGLLYYSKNGQKWPCSKNPTKQVENNAEILTEYLENKKEITIAPIPILIMVRGKLGLFINKPTVDIVELDQLEQAINNANSQNLSPEYIHKLINTLVYKRCPRCGGFLVKRNKTGYAYFLGCSNYPSCTFMEEI